MQIIRIYTGTDNQTHFQEVDLDTFTAIATNPGPGPIRFNHRRTGDTVVADFHNAPRRQYVMMLSGIMEIETGLGEKRVLHPGDVLIAEDITGKGHITRSTGGDLRATLSVPLAGAAHG